MNNEMKINTCLSARIFMSSTIFPVFLALAFVSSVAFAQEPQDSSNPQETPVYYLKQNQEQKHTWNDSTFWSDNAYPATTTDSIFVVGNGFHLRPQRVTDVTFGYYYNQGSHTNKLYIGYKVDLATGEVDLNDYGEDVYAVLHLKTGAKRPTEGNITVDDLYIGHGEIFQGENEYYH